MINEIIEKLTTYTEIYDFKFWTLARCEGPVYEFMFEKHFDDGYVDYFKFWIDINQVESVKDTVNGIMEYYIPKIYGPDAVTM